jgi:predicted DNA-binding protein
MRRQQTHVCPIGQGGGSVDTIVQAMYVSYIMKRTQIYLQSDQDRRLAIRATAAGTTKSTLIREAIESYLASSPDDAARLAQFHDALDAVERSPVDLADGRVYVEHVRQADELRRDEIEKRRT